MSGLHKIVLVAVIVLPPTLRAQNDPKNMAKQPLQQTYMAESNSGASHSSSGAKRVIRKVLHGLNPMVWMAYLSRREPCSYAYSQAYGVCENKAPVR
jgi:hypothetical protein